MTVVDIHEAKTQLSALIQKVLNGEEVIIAKNNKPLVSLNKLKKQPEKRKGFGSLKDKIWVSNDCWDEDQELLNIMYNGPIFPDEDTD